MTAILKGLLTLLALLLPFEARRPVVSFAPYMVFTDLELVTLLTIGVWAARGVVLRIADRPPGRFTGSSPLPGLRNEKPKSLKSEIRNPKSEIGRSEIRNPKSEIVRRRQAPALPGRLGLLTWGLAGIALLSAATAPAFQLASLKFTLRMVTGVCLLCVVAGQGISLKALVAGAAVSSALGVWTCLQPDQAAYLTPLFREREFLIGNSVRLSGTFEYPNIAAAFLAMGFTLSLGFRVYSLLWAVAQGLILLGLIMTLSRAGLAVALFGFGVVMTTHIVRGGAEYYRMRRMSPYSILSILCIPVKPFLPALIVTALCLAGALLLYPPFLLRLQTGGDQAWYSARYETLEAPILSAGGISTATVRVTNTGRIPWIPKGDHPFRLSYHWLEAGTERAIPALQARTELPGEVAPGQSVTLTARVLAPAAPGDYLLAWDMVHERAAWFSQKGCPPGRVACRVGEASGGPPALAGREEAPPDPTALEAESVSRSTLWRAGWAMFKRHPALGVGPDNFRRLWGREYGMGRWDERVHANNLFVEVFATTGLLGGIAFLALIVSILRMQVGFLVQTFKRSNVQTSYDAKFSEMAALFGATGVFLAHGMVDCFIAFTPIYLLFWAVAGMSARMAYAR